MMKRSVFFTFLLIFLAFTFSAQAQKRRAATTVKKPITTAAQKNPENSSNSAVVIDERLAVLRAEPSLFARPIQRMRRGRKLSISGTREADGVTFYRVTALPGGSGWVQAEAISGIFRSGEDARLARLVQSSDGFDQIERAKIFLDTFPDSSLRPAILLLLGDLMEETASKMSTEATRRLSRREMAASGAPIHSFYLNYTSLDRYRRLGINFVFNSNTKVLHYDGANWREIVKKFPNSSEASEAQKRLDALREKLEKANN